MIRNNKNIIMILLVMIGLSWPTTVYASHSDNIPVRLIASMSYQDEYEGLLHLGFLDTKALKIENFQKAVELVRSSAVRIEAGNFNGSGSIFELNDSKIIIVSCRHLLQFDETPSVIFGDSYTTEGNVVYLSEQADLGFIEINPNSLPIQTIRSCKRVVKRGSETQQVIDHTKIFHIGSGSQAIEDTFIGTVLDPWKFFPEFNTFMIHGKCYGEPGMSGGGTFDLKGHYLGMILGGNDEETASLPLSLIEDEWDIAFGQEATQQ
ncbi:MAG: serine protease [Lachnospiraceae bacterium]|nr:serine protease [Lachnospiraceae bacterium]